MFCSHLCEVRAPATRAPMRHARAMNVDDIFLIGEFAGRDRA